MKYLVSLTVMFLFAVNLNGQAVSYPDKNDSSIIRIKEYYSSCGKIFTKDETNFLSSLNGKNFFKPGVQDILLAEQLMTEKYSSAIGSDERAKSLVGTEYKERYYKYYRQYVGIVNTSGDKVIFIQLFKCCKKNISKCFPNWKKELVTPLDEDRCTITIAFIVNLTDRKSVV